MEFDDRNDVISSGLDDDAGKTPHAGRSKNPSAPDSMASDLNSSDTSSYTEEEKQGPRGTSIEMTDLKASRGFEMKEFAPVKSTNQSQKKREKRKLKKAEEDAKQKILEEQKQAEQQARAREEFRKAGQSSHFTTNEGKTLKKKVVPKKQVVDETGTWDVVEKKKTLIVEESDSDDSDL